MELATEIVVRDDDRSRSYSGSLLVTGNRHGCDVFERAVADPDTLADLDVIRTASAEGENLECEATLSVVWDAHLTATGETLPDDAFTIEYPELDPAWDFDFDDQSEMRRRLPRLAALYLD